MSLFTKLYEAVQSWRRRRVEVKPSRGKRSGPTLEQLDHRQLLAVNFTGVVTNDFPQTTGPGVQVVNGIPITNPQGVTTNLPGANNAVPIIAPVLQGVISASGYQIDQLRVSYTQADDTLNVGVRGGIGYGQNGNDVIAGDADNNGNSGTVNPIINNPTTNPPSGLDTQFQDPPDMGGTETYGISLALGGSTTPQVLAGFPTLQDPTDLTAKPFTVGLAQPQTSASQFPLFDFTQTLPQYTGNYYLANDPNRPNFELQIPRFSQLYQQVTGQAFSQTSAVSIGAFAAQLNSVELTEEVFAPLPLNIPQITVPPPTPPGPPIIIVPPPDCPPMSPTVYVNPHLKNHVNTAHNGAIRVNILGSSGFDPTTIIPSTVRLGSPDTVAVDGALPILNFENNVNRDRFADETFVFNGLDLNLPPGITDATILGTTTSGQTFSSTVTVFNRDASYYTPAQLNAQQARFARYDADNGIDSGGGLVAPPTRVPTSAQVRANSQAINDLYNPFKGVTPPRQVNPGAVRVAVGSGTVTSAGLAAAPAGSGGTVSIPRKNGKAAQAAVKVTKAARTVRAGKAAPVMAGDMPTTMNLAGAS